jgi:hypothetical protein
LIAVEVMPPKTAEERTYIHLEKVDSNLIIELADGREVEVEFRAIYTAIGALARFHSREYISENDRR